MGVRRNNAQLIRSGKHMTKELFFDGRHPIYTKIEMHDTIQYNMMPEEVRLVLDDYSSLTTSGNFCLGEDLDYLHEELNRTIKQYVPAGTLPSNKLWEQICRNSEFLEGLQERTMKLSGMTMSSGYLKNINLANAISEFQVILRGHDYLNIAGDTHKSLSGHKLHCELVNFAVLATARRCYFIDKHVLHHPARLQKLEEFIFVTEEEESKYSIGRAKVKDMIATMSHLLNSLSLLCPDVHRYLLQTYQEKFAPPSKPEKVACHEFIMEVRNCTQWAEDVLDQVDTSGENESQVCLSPKQDDCRHM